jgi:hypothetical protein
MKLTIFRWLSFINGLLVEATAVSSTAPLGVALQVEIVLISMDAAPCFSFKYQLVASEYRRRLSLLISIDSLRFG